eukprot:1592749-Alexandrium_andersonii.AAC.1
MSASLVGSEMCIRDRVDALPGNSPRLRPGAPPPALARLLLRRGLGGRRHPGPPWLCLQRRGPRARS